MREGKGKYRIALYMRLSREDAKDGGESGSIRTQRMLLRRYVEAHFCDYEELEFCDDGYSGTNFNRPGVMQLLSLVREMAVDCIVVKDFSRFSRDYIDLGDYIQQIFPFMGVRFISVNDGFDSGDGKQTAPELDLYFKSLLYDLYSKDLSVKVRTSLAARKKRGQYVSANCPFGYKKDPDDRHALMVREEEAAVVRRIFQMTLKGHTSFSIARQFNEEGVKTPAMFRRERGETGRQPKKGGFIWYPAVICRILRSEVYVGDLVYGKTVKESVGGKNRPKPRSEWGRYRNHHEPIIDRRTFDLVQEGRGTAKGRSEEKTHPLTGYAVCGGCGHNLQLHRGSAPYFFCPCRPVSPREECVRKMDAASLEQYVLFRMQSHVWQTVDREEMRLKKRRADQRKLEEWQEQGRELKRKMAGLKMQKTRAYEAFSAGKTTDTAYRETALRIAAEEEFLAGKLAGAQLQVKLLQTKVCREPGTAEMLEYFGLSSLTGESVSEWVERIVVSCEGSPGIQWKVLH